MEKQQKSARSATNPFKLPAAKKFQLTIRLPDELKRRYDQFFTKCGWSNENEAKKLEILLALAETHPDVQDDGMAETSADRKSVV